MNRITPVEEVLHRVRVRLRPGRLPGAGGRYCARIVSEATLSVEEVCASLKLRGGFTGSYEDAVMITRQFIEEAAYQLCNGFAVNLHYFSIHPSVGGYFDSPHESPLEAPHPIRFRFRTRKPMRALAPYITVEVMQADRGGCINQFVDYDSGAINGAVSPGGLFTLTGNRLKIRGGNPACGLYFVGAGNSAARFKAGRLLSNTSGKLTGKVPALPPGVYTLEVVTQHTTGAVDLREPRVIASGFTLTAS